MATRKPPPPAQANLTVEQMRKGIARLEKLIGEIEAFDATELTKRWGPEQKALEATIEGTLTSVLGTRPLSTDGTPERPTLTTVVSLWAFVVPETTATKLASTSPRARWRLSIPCNQRSNG